jgi:hypothetical protein
MISKERSELWSFILCRPPYTMEQAATQTPIGIHHVRVGQMYETVISIYSSPRRTVPERFCQMPVCHRLMSLHSIRLIGV